MKRRFPTIQTLLLYGIARLRVLASNRSTWAVLLGGGVLVLAVMGTSAAWRARTGGTEDHSPAPAILQSPIVDHTTSEAAIPSRPEALDSATASSTPVHAAPAAQRTALPTPLRAEVSTTAIEEGRAQCEAEQPPHTTSSQLVVSRTTADSAAQREERTRVRKTRSPLPAPSRMRKAAASLPPPAVTVISVSSTAALIQRGHWRQMIQRGTRLNGWTVTRLTPTGLTLQRGRQQAVAPLSFAVRAASTR